MVQTQKTPSAFSTVESPACKRVKCYQKTFNTKKASDKALVMFFLSDTRVEANAYRFLSCSIAHFHKTRLNSVVQLSSLNVKCRVYLENAEFRFLKPRTCFSSRFDKSVKYGASIT